MLVGIRERVHQEQLNQVEIKILVVLVEKEELIETEIKELQNLELLQQDQLIFTQIIQIHQHLIHT